MSFSRQFFFFGISGVAGFIVDSTVLYLSKALLGLYIARLLSFSCAVLSTWFFNRAITFRTRTSGHSRLREFCIYFGLMLAGGVVNYTLYALLVTAYPFIASHPVLGVAAGSVAGMGVNLLTSRFLLFRFQRK